MKLILDDGTEVQLEHIKVKELAPSDVVVVKTVESLTYDQGQHVIEYIKRVFPNNQVLLLHSGVEIEITREKP